MILAELFPYAGLAYKILLYGYMVAVVAVIIIIISENRNPVKSLAWVTVLLLLPWVGLLLYILFGRNLKGYRLISRRGKKKLHPSRRKTEENTNDKPDRLWTSDARMVHMVGNIADSKLLEGNKIEIFTSGAEKFETLKRDLLAAKRYIHLQYYIYENDRIGREIREILIQKASEGVTVRVMYDHFGSFTINAAFFQRMRRSGVEAHAFLKLTLTKLANRLNWRNHRKIVVIDGKIGYIGGMNIADRYVYGDHGKPAWRDTHLRIIGPAVADMEYCFAVDWSFTKRDLLIDEAEQATEACSDGDPVQIVPGGPTGLWNSMSFVFLRAIAGARRCVFLQTPYFLPSDALLKALQSAALSGVDVRIMLPRKNDSPLLRLASGSYIKECLLAGIKIFFYEPAMLHSKVVIVDDDFATTGSTNFDFRSFEHNFECNAVVHSRAFNRRMKEIFYEDQRHCTRIILSHWRRRPVAVKALESIFRLMAPIL